MNTRVLPHVSTSSQQQKKYIQPQARTFCCFWDAASRSVLLSIVFYLFFFYFKRLLNRKCCSLSLSVALVRSVCYCLFLNTSTGLSFFAVDPWGYSVFIRLTAHMLSTLCITYTWNWKRKSFIQSYPPDPFPFLTNLFFHWLYLA